MYAWHVLEEVVNQRDGGDRLLAKRKKSAPTCRLKVVIKSLPKTQKKKTKKKRIVSAASP